MIAGQPLQTPLKRGFAVGGHFPIATDALGLNGVRAKRDGKRRNQRQRDEFSKKRKTSEHRVSEGSFENEKIKKPRYGSRMLENRSALRSFGRLCE
ncbi:MAG: hypothetical protein QM811_13600 [Pirellulales bacterium]